MIYPYMIGDETVGAYKTAVEHSLNSFKLKQPLEMAKKAGATFDEVNSSFDVPSLGQSIKVSYPSGKISFKGSSQLPLWEWRLVVLNYLSRADGTPLSYRPVSYRELEDGNVFYPAFIRQAKSPLINKLADYPLEIIKKACESLGGQLLEGADVSAVLWFLPRFPVTIKIWLPDDELDGSANILFDASANHYLHTEDIAVVGSIVSSFIIQQTRMLTHK